MSLGQKGKDDTEIFDYCIEHNVVGLGWGEDKDFSQCTKREDFKALEHTSVYRNLGSVTIIIVGDVGQEMNLSTKDRSY